MKKRLSLKNFLLPGKFIIIWVLLIPTIKGKSQIINYVSNGSFEECVNCSVMPYKIVPKYWGPIDTSSFAFFYCGLNSPLSNLPLFSVGYYQLPRTGNNIIASTIYCDLSSCTYTNSRNYPRNRLKTKLKANTTYCVKYFVVNANISSIGIDAFGAYFGDSSIDSITFCRSPLTFLNPQIQNTNGNIIKDTLNWIPVTGTFVANGTEKYMILGNFKTGAATNTSLINPSQLPQIGTDVFYDDVSVIELNLPAFAGRDTSVAPGSTVFIGRQPDVGIDEACVWYKLPGTVPIDTVAGFWVNPTTTSTYVVVQTICGLVKSDTVVIHMNLLDINNNRFRNSAWQVYPVPANDYLELRVSNPEEFTNYTKYCMYNQLGQFVKEEEISIKAESTLISTGDLPVGVYSLTLKNADSETLVKRFVILR